MLGPFIRLCMLIGCSLAVVLLLTFFAGYFVRQKSATWIAFFSSLIMMITDLFLYGQFAEWKFEYQEKKRKIEIQSSLSSVRLESLTHLSQESQKLPILDSARPLTLANSIHRSRLCARGYFKQGGPSTSRDHCFYSGMG